MDVYNKPSAVFGRRGREVRSAPAPVDIRETRPRARVSGNVISLSGVTILLLVVVVAVFWTMPNIEELNQASAQAAQRVVEIVNQPIAHLPRSGQAGVFSPGWFHAGAISPDFNNVDIRTTQEFPYAGYDYVTSDVNPSEMFIGSELEFNSMTKYFYTDRTLPKRRLSNAEMVEINGLYRIIGQDEQALPMRWAAIVGLAIAGFCLGAALLMLIRRTLHRSAD